MDLILIRLILMKNTAKKPHIRMEHARPVKSFLTEKTVSCPNIEITSQWEIELPVLHRKHEGQTEATFKKN
jgi:hypothetical protein